MRRQDTVALSREAKKEILKVHVSYIRSQLELCEDCHSKGDEETYDLIMKNLYDSCFYLKNIEVFSIEKAIFLSKIITNYSMGILMKEPCPA